MVDEEGIYEASRALSTAMYWCAGDGGWVGEYMFWMSSVFREAEVSAQVGGPPLPVVEANGQQVQIARGSISWTELYGGRLQHIEGDMFMSVPQLVRFKGLEALAVTRGTALTIHFPVPTSTIVLSRWRYGREVEAQPVANGYSFVPTTRGVHIFGVSAAFPGEPDGSGRGTAQYAFMIRVR